MARTAKKSAKKIAKKTAKKGAKKIATAKTAVKRVRKPNNLLRAGAPLNFDNTAVEPSAAAIARARPIVLAALGFGKIPDGTKLSDLEFDPPSLAGLAQDLRRAGVNINDGPVIVCDTVLCVIKAVARVNG